MRIAMMSSGYKSVPGTDKAIYAPGQLIYWITEELVKRGHDVTLFGASGTVTSAHLIGKEISPAFEQYSQQQIDDPVIRTEVKWETDLYLCSRLVEEHRRQPFDVIHGHDYRRLLHFSKSVDAPLIYTYHGNPIDDTKNNIDKTRLKYLFDSNYFVGISNKQIELGKEYFNFVGKVYHGLDLNDFPYQAKSGIDLLWAGRIMAGKNPDIAIQAAINTNHNITIAGEGSGNYYESILSLLQNPNVDYKGFVSYKEMPGLMGKAKAIIVPITWHEPFGMIIIEALACGTPVIGYNFGALPELVKDGQTGYIIDSSEGVSGLEKAINKLYSLSESDYTNMRKTCRTYIEENHTVKKMVDGYENIYNQIV